MRSVAVIGSVSLDTNRIDSRELRKLGGVVTYAGLTLRRHGVPTVVITSIGTMDGAKLAPLRHEGVDVRAQWGRHTTAFINTLDHDTRAQRLVAMASPIEGDEIARLPQEVDTFLVGALHPDDVSERAFDTIERSEALIALDLQGFVRTVVDGAVRASASSRLTRSLRVAHVVKADEEELAIACEALGCSANELASRFEISELLETKGSRGGRILKVGEGWIDYAAEPVEEIVDTTGAGDVFFASYLVSRFRDHLAVTEAARRAAHIATLQVSGHYLSGDTLTLD